jgi:hypothetical protein
MDIVWLEPWAPIEQPEVREAMESEWANRGHPSAAATQRPHWLNARAIIIPGNIHSMPVIDPDSSTAIKLARFGEAFRACEKRKSTSPPERIHYFCSGSAVAHHFRSQIAGSYHQGASHSEPNVTDHQMHSSRSLERASFTSVHRMHRVFFGSQKDYRSSDCGLPVVPRERTFSAPPCDFHTAWASSGSQRGLK